MICDKCEEDMNDEDDDILEIRLREDLTINIHWSCWLLCVGHTLIRVSKRSKLI